MQLDKSQENDLKRLAGEDAEEPSSTRSSPSLYNVPRPDLWGGMAPQHLRLCAKSVAGRVAFTRFVGAKEVPQVGESNRRTADLSTRYEGDVQTWVDLGGKTRTGAAVMIQPCDHDMKFVMLPLALKL